MICGTTPNIVCNVNVDLREWDHVRMTVTDGSVMFNIDDSDLCITETTVSATLTQKQTLLFKQNSLQIQLKAKTGDRVAATPIQRLPISKILDHEVM